MYLHVLSLVHVAISLVGITSGVVIMAHFIKGRLPEAWNKIFLVSTAATSATGFFFRFKGVTPGVVTAVLSLCILTVAVKAWKLEWRKTYISTAIAAAYLNVLVLIVQLFQKVPALHASVDHGSKMIMPSAQLASLILFAGIGFSSIRRSRKALTPETT